MHSPPGAPSGIVAHLVIRPSPFDLQVIEHQVSKRVLDERFLALDLGVIEHFNEKLVPEALCIRTCGCVHFCAPDHEAQP